MVVVSADGLLKLPLSLQRANAIDDVDQDVAKLLRAQIYKFRESLGVKKLLSVNTKYAPMEAGKFADFLAGAAAEVRRDKSIANDPEGLKLAKGADIAANMSPALFARAYLRLAGTISASMLLGNRQGPSSRGTQEAQGQ
ncbi:hypothetical protein TI39_contig4162g00002 [Zymoseptoria brevis]|uniref:Uncharacterized protein n=1 Tax=Zymoseptoria brevis TaxID=1047168 RepID=A0A0F4GBK9_9PEZI|nr:hypothetical protein TI39_contig4162g00002 [Zymoseptoria brevis]